MMDILLLILILIACWIAMLCFVLFFCDELLDLFFGPWESK